jgi:hypothetical protein
MREVNNPVTWKEEYKGWYKRKGDKIGMEYMVNERMW